MIMKEMFQRMCLKLETMKLKNADTNDHERNVSTNVLEIVLERQNTFHNQKEF